MIAYVDSSVWITRIEGHPTYRKVIQTLIDRYIQDGWNLCASHAVLMEVLYKPYLQQNNTLISLYMELFETFDILSSFDKILEDGLELVKNDGLKAMDSIHVALAIHQGCDAFITTDADFRHLSAPTLHMISLPKIT